MRLKTIILAATLLCAAGVTTAQNPVDLQRAQAEATRIHRQTIVQIAQKLGSTDFFVLSYINQPEAGRVSQEIELTGKQHRELNRYLAEQNQKARDAYERRGIHAPKDIDLRINF
jgi:DNA-binding MarR family transcriptional regulator